MPGSSNDSDPGRAAPAPGEGRVLFVARYADDPAYEFRAGTRMRFGRDDSTVEIPIWERIHDTVLSKVAGELWCTGEGQMWARNLSEAHELVVAGDDEVPTTLPARRPDALGHARSVPVPGVLSVPSTGTWRILVEAVAVSAAVPADGHGREQVRSLLTIRVEEVPATLVNVAKALCAPLLAHGPGAPPATYTEIAAALDCTPRSARRKTEQLCERYQEVIESLPGGRRPDETLAAAVARLLVDRKLLDRQMLGRQP